MTWARGERIKLDDLARLMAKNSMARLLWVVSRETGASLFGSDLNNWSMAQIAFTNWCLFYDSIYESYECPPERVIKDDELIDDWMENQKIKRNEESESKYSKRGGGTLSALDHAEHYAIEEI